MSSTESLLLLRRAGIVDPARVVGLIRRTITFFELDLSGLVVLTEAASGPYVVTPIIAALAGAARVIALTATSRYGSVEAVIAQTRALAELCGVSVQVDDASAGAAGDENLIPDPSPAARGASSPTRRGEDAAPPSLAGKGVGGSGATCRAGPVAVSTARRPELFAAADIITNLGFVRPIDAAAVAAMKPTAVVPLMCEGWEIRSGDLDLAACRARAIPVIATNEDYPGLEVFAYSGWLALKMLFDAQIEVHKSRLAVVSSDKFGPVIADRLDRAGASVRLLPHLRAVPAAALADLDALIIADYTRADLIIGPDGDMTVDALVETCPGATVIQFAGCVDVPGLLAAGAHLYPGVELPPQRMAFTLAALGPRPAIELHAAGLKVGELAARARLAGRPVAEIGEVAWRGHVLGIRVA